MLASFALFLWLQSSPATSRPAVHIEKATVEESLQELGERLERTLNAGDGRLYDRAFDVDAVIDRAFAERADKPMGALTRKGFIMGFQDSGGGGWLSSDWLLERVEEGSELHFLKSSRSGADHVLLFRLLDADQWVDYVEVIVAPEPKGKLRIVDGAEWSSGQRLSEQLEQLTPNLETEEVPPATEAVLELNELFEAGDFEGALARYEALGEEVRRDRTVLQMAMGLAANVSLDKLLDVLEVWRKAYPQDVAPDLLMVNVAYELSSYEDRLAQVERLQKATGGDAFLDFEEGNVHTHYGEFEKAVEAYRRSAERESELGLPQLALLEFALADERHADAARWLAHLIDVCGIPLAEFEDWSGYTAFEASPVGRAWLAERER